MRFNDPKKTIVRIFMNKFRDDDVILATKSELQELLEEEAEEFDLFYKTKWQSGHQKN